MLCASLAERIFLFENRENLRIFPIYFFTGGVVAASGICSAAFCESAALRETGSPSQSKPVGVDSSPKGRGLGKEVQFAATTPPVKK